MEDYIDLTGVELQGKFGHDYLDTLDKPGKYIIPTCFGNLKTDAFNNYSR